MISARGIFGQVLVASISLLVIPNMALAATVSVSETPGEVNRAALVFTAGPGEQNELTISRKVQLLGYLDEFNIADPGAGLTPGPGCSGGGSAGVPVSCVMHSPRGSDYESCGHSCFTPVKGTAWEATVSVELGDGNDSLDAGSLPGRFTDAYTVVANGGEGADSITTAGGSDTIDPGPGNDVLRTGDGHDTAFASATSDGNDLYDLGADSFDRVDYRARTTPVLLAGDVSGAAGESDSLLGVEFLVGGSADDSLATGATPRTLDGRAGDDLLVGGSEDDRLLGGPGNDVLRGLGGKDGMSGGDDDDSYQGGDGDDSILEWAQIEKAGADNITLASTSLPPSLGDDTADGGPGDDRIELGPGDDRATGQEGNDILNGEEGADLLEGDAGDDRVAGEAGPDRLLGGPGSDELLAARLDDHIYTTDINGTPGSPVDSWRDSVDCGPDTDEAAVNRWDQTEACELVRRVRAVRILNVEHRRRAGVAVLTAKTFGPGLVTMRSRGRTSIRAVHRRVFDDEEAFLPVRASHRTLIDLRRTGRVRVTVWISFRPADGIVRRESAHVNLVLAGS